MNQRYVFAWAALPASVIQFGLKPLAAIPLIGAAGPTGILAAALKSGRRLHSDIPSWKQ